MFSFTIGSAFLFPQNGSALGMSIQRCISQHYNRMLSLDRWTLLFWMDNPAEPYLAASRPIFLVKLGPGLSKFVLSICHAIPFIAITFYLEVTKR